MPPGAFLRSPVSSIDMLNRELRTDTLVVSRYSRLLRLAPDMVRATFAQLHLTHLQKDMTLEVHYVHAGETMGAKVRRVRKGTAVFALPNGTPVLAQVCGNPLRAIGQPIKQLVMRSEVVQSEPNGANMAAIDDAPEFDPTEPITAPADPLAFNSITVRGADPEVQTLSKMKSALASDEMPANELEAGEILPTRTIAQAKSSLLSWVAGGTTAALVGMLGSSNTVEVVAGPVSGIREPVLPLPGNPSNVNPAGPAATPEPNSVMFLVTLATTMLASVGLRRRKSR